MVILPSSELELQHFELAVVCLLSVQGNHPVERYNNLALRSWTHEL